MIRRRRLLLFFLTVSLLLLSSVVLSKLQPGEIVPVVCNDGNIDHDADNAFYPLTHNVYKLGLPSTVRESLLSLLEGNGILKFLPELMAHPLKPGQNHYKMFDKSLWFIQRPNPLWRSNMHWISPGEDKTQLEYLQALGDGGFDEILKSIGENLGLDGIVCYHLTFIVVTACDHDFVRYDFYDTDERAFNVIMPLTLVDDSPPELNIRADNFGEELVGINYELDTAIMLGDDAYHATATIDYTGTGQFRFAASVYIGDVNEDNVRRILKEYTQPYPPKSDEYLLSKSGIHWKKDDPNVRLPRSFAGKKDQVEL